MCIFKTNFLNDSSNFTNNLINSISKGNYNYFNIATKKNRNIKKVKTYDTIVFLYKLFSDHRNNNVNYINHGGFLINFKTIPTPKLIKEIKIFKQRQNIIEGNDFVNNSNVSLSRLLYGNKINTNDLKKSSIMKKIIDLYPIELKNIIFNFAHKYMDSMSNQELLNFNEIIDIDSGQKNSILLDYILARTDVPKEILERNSIFPKLLKFISSTHPLLENE